MSMELERERLFDVKERIARKWVILSFVVVAAVGFPAVWFGPRIYSHFQQGRLLRKARLSLEKEDVANEAILLRRVLDLNPDNVDAARAMAELAESYVPGEAPALRERVCQLAPASYADAMAWALTALRLGQTAQAEDAFELMKKLGKPSVAFYEIGARVALASGSVAEARAGFEHALQVDPSNEGDQLELASLDIHSPDATGRQRARDTLERLRSNPKLHHAALRALVGDRIERSMYSEALTLAADFVNDPEATFQDRLQYLGILRMKEDPSFVFTTTFNEKGRIPLGLLADSPEPSFASYLNDLEAEARENAGKVASLVTFLNSRGLSLLACEWTGTMPRAFVAALPIAPQLAEAYRLTLDWRRIEDLVADGSWGGAEFLRFAYCSRVAQEKGDRAGAAAQWATAVKLTEYRHERLVVLARLASAWGWSGEFEEILWTSARNSKRPRQALEELAELAHAKRDTPKLFTIWSRLLELDPADVAARKNWVRLSLLLNHERYRTGSMAQELYQQHPEDPEIATGYAMVLHLRLQEAEALAVMNKLTPEQLRAPSVAGYYGIVLFANQRKDEAAGFLARAVEAPLLREEIALMDQTRRALDVNPQRR